MGVVASLLWIENPIAMQGDTMEATLLERIKQQLVRHESLRLKPYRCTADKLTIGIGRNLDNCGISQTEAYVLLENDIQNCEKQLLDEIPDINNNLDEVRKSVLLNMCFNLGISGLLGFNNTLAFIATGDWERAANSMLASKWAKQVDNGIFKEHRTLVLEMVRSVVLHEHYTRAIQEDMPEEDPLLISFRFGFCFLTLHSTCEFLNLKTLGEGIIKTVGLDQSATELLTGSEITICFC